VPIKPITTANAKKPDPNANLETPANGFKFANLAKPAKSRIKLSTNEMAGKIIQIRLMNFLPYGVRAPRAGQPTHPALITALCSTFSNLSQIALYSPSGRMAPLRIHAAPPLPGREKA
jgi:hypothetical protein